MDPRPSIEHLAISRAGSAVLGFKYHRDIAFTTTDLAIVCYSVIAMIDVPIPGAWRCNSVAHSCRPRGNPCWIRSLDTPRKTLPRKGVFHLPQRYLRNVATRALSIVVFPRLIVGKFSPLRRVSWRQCKSPKCLSKASATDSEMDGIQHSILRWQLSASRFLFDTTKPEDIGGELPQHCIFSTRVFRSRALNWQAKTSVARIAQLRTNRSTFGLAGLAKRLQFRFIQ